MARSKNSSFNMPKNRKNKLHLVFDEEKRREFLLGFHKRKLQRKKKAQEELKLQLKEEKTRLKQEARERYKKLVTSRTNIPDFEDVLKEEYETEGVTVNVISLSANNIAKQNNWIGPNQPQYESEDEGNSNNMPLENENKNMVFKTEKDVKKVLKKQATKTVQKSKVYQMKYKIDKQKMKKKARQQKRERMKIRSRNGKGIVKDR